MVSVPGALYVLMNYTFLQYFGPYKITFTVLSDLGGDWSIHSQKTRNVDAIKWA